MHSSEEINQQQEGDAEEKTSPPPLGLTMTVTASLLNLVEKRLSDAGARQQMGDFASQQTRKKLELPSNFPASLLTIGSWERVSRHQGDLVAKIYYGKRRLIWEILEGALKSKIEVQWSHVSAIRAIFHDNQHDILEIELNQAPQFFREINPQPRRQINWEKVADFTGGQALICRRHSVKFPPGTLEKHYEKLLHNDQRLLDLSQKPFPSLDDPYFRPNTYGFSDLPGDFRGCLPAEFFPQHNPNSQMSDEGGNNSYADEGVNHQIQGLPSISTSTPGNPFIPRQEYNTNYVEESSWMNNSNDELQLLDDIENHLLGGAQAYSDEMSIPAKMSSMSSLLEPQQQEPNLVQSYPQPITRLPSQDSNMDTSINPPPTNESLYPYLFSDPTLEDFAKLDANPDFDDWCT